MSTETTSIHLHFKINNSAPPPASKQKPVFKLFLPSSTEFSSSLGQALQEKLRKTPAICHDKLHPKTKEAQPYVEYIDEGLWKSRITFHKDLSYSVFQSQIKAIITASQGTSFPNLDALCDAELKKRFPNHLPIYGVKAVFKDKFPHLAKLLMGKEQFHNELTPKEINKYKKQIAYSACNRDDLQCNPIIEDQALCDQLDVKDNSLLQTEHIFAKNSPMNGQSFIHKGNRINLTQAIACSNDRKVENTGNLRVVQTKSKESICYTGRADSDRKALEQASFIFFNELKTKGKGITRTIDENGKVIFQLDYVANSLLSIPWLWSTESPIAPFPEREYIEEERKAFIKLKESGHITIEDPNSPGHKYQVQFNPILFSRSFNIFTRLENWLPPFLTGSSRAQEINEEGYAQLKPITEWKLIELKQKITTVQSENEKKGLEQQIQGIESSLKALEAHEKKPHLRPEEELLYRDYLCKMLNLPLIYHCKSSTDRTSVSNALSAALKQWIELKLPIPFPLANLIKDFRFKELFAANWMAGHQITRYARGGKGTVAAEKLNNKNLGLHLSRGIAQNPTVAHLLPERYLSPFPTSQKIKTTALYLLLLIPIILLFYLPLMAITTVRHIKYVATKGKNPQWIGPLKFTLPFLLTTLIFDFPTIFPSKVLNENSTLVKDRKLIAGGKNGGETDTK